MNPADRECVERLQAGDPEALAELYDRYGALLHPLALRITGNAAEADEALYEAWMQVVRRSVPFDPRRGTAAWLLSIVRARALERRRATAAKGGGAPAPDEGTIEVVAERVELADRAIEALGLFDDHERKVLELAFYDGLTQNEISSMLSVSLRDVRMWTRQGLDRLHAAHPQQEAA
jgi:RNA polymerase sigma-70 factor, ECF subfamily